MDADRQSLTSAVNKSKVKKYRNGLRGDGPDPEDIPLKDVYQNILKEDKATNNVSSCLITNIIHVAAAINASHNGQYF